MTAKRFSGLLAGATLVASWIAADALHAQRPGGRRGFESLRTPLRVGQAAPDFELERLLDSKPKTAKSAARRAQPLPGAETPKGPAKVRLSSFRGKRPVVLFFGSYT